MQVSVVNAADRYGRGLSGQVVTSTIWKELNTRRTVIVVKVVTIMLEPRIVDDTVVEGRSLKHLNIF